MNILLNQMLAKADPTQVAGLARFFKTGPGQYGEGDEFLGIKVPVTRAVVKECWRRLGTPLDGRSTGFPELEECMASPYHEVRLAALLSLVEIFRHSHSGQERSMCVDFYLSHTAGINNWDLVDLSCYPLLGEWLLDKDRTLLYTLARSGKTLWEQRIGMVSTMTFIRHGQLEDTFAIADILLHHPHDLIHKAVGWLLREAGKKDKAALEAWLQGTPEVTRNSAAASARPTASENYFSGQGPKNQFPEATANLTHADAGLPRYRTLPRTMLRYAIEKFPEGERKAYLAK